MFGFSKRKPAPQIYTRQDAMSDRYAKTDPAWRWIVSPPEPFGQGVLYRMLCAEFEDRPEGLHGYCWSTDMWYRPLTLEELVIYAVQTTPKPKPTFGALPWVV